MAETKKSSWAEWLDEFTYIINSTVHHTTNKTPFELLSGVPPREAFFPSLPSGLLLEEDIQDMIVNEEIECQTVEATTNMQTTDNRQTDDVEATVTETVEATSGNSDIQTDCIDDPIRPTDDIILAAVSDADLSTESRILNVRRVSLDNYLKSAKRMKEKYDRKNKVNDVCFDIGENVTIKVPSKSRKKNDLPRIAGVIVAKSAHKTPQYRVRTYAGVLKDLITVGSLEKYRGELDISVENWKNSPKVSFKEVIQQSNQSPSHLHSTTDGTTTNEEAFPHQLTACFYQQLLLEEFSETSCETMKEVLNDITITALKSTCSAIVSACPPVPDNATDINIAQLGEFGDGYSPFIPEGCRRLGLVPVRSSSTGNSCLYNSTSILLYGNENKSEFLRLAATCSGVLYHQEIVDKIIHKYPAKEDIIAWANHVTTDTVLQEVDECEVREIAEHVILQELKMSLQNLRDSAEIQMLALATFLKRPIQQYINDANYDHCKELVEPLRFEENLHPLNLLWVPCSPNVASGEAVFNHLVPLVSTERLAYTLPDSYNCGARRIDRCAFKNGGYPEIYRPKQIQCNYCKMWYHTVCIEVNAENYKKKPFFCGCQNPDPLNSKRPEFYDNWDDIKSTLCEINIKALQQKLIEPLSTDGMPSLRYYVNRHKGSYFKLRQELRNTMFGPFTDERIVELIHIHISLECGRTRHDDIVMDVILPEVIIKLVQINEGFNRFQAEVFLRR